MDRALVFERLRSEIATMLEVHEDTISEQSLLMDELEADSIDLLDLVLVLREEFNIASSDDELKSLLMDLADLLPGLFTGAPDPELSDEKLIELSSRLRVGTIVDFVIKRLQ